MPYRPGSRGWGDTAGFLRRQTIGYDCSTSWKRASGQQSSATLDGRRIGPCSNSAPAEASHARHHSFGDEFPYARSEIFVGVVEMAVTTVPVHCVASPVIVWLARHLLGVFQSSLTWLTSLADCRRELVVRLGSLALHRGAGQKQPAAGELGDQEAVLRLPCERGCVRRTLAASGAKRTTSECCSRRCTSNPRKRRRLSTRLFRPRERIKRKISRKKQVIFTWTCANTWRDRRTGCQPSVFECWRLRLISCRTIKSVKNRRERDRRPAPPAGGHTS